LNSGGFEGAWVRWRSRLCLRRRISPRRMATRSQCCRRRTACIHIYIHIHIHMSMRGNWITGGTWIGRGWARHQKPGSPVPPMDTDTDTDMDTHMGMLWICAWHHRNLSHNHNRRRRRRRRRHRRRVCFQCRCRSHSSSNPSCAHSSNFSTLRTPRGVLLRGAPPRLLRRAAGVVSTALPRGALNLASTNASTRT